MKLFVFGHGYSARALARRLDGWSVAAAYRSTPPEGVAAVRTDDREGWPPPWRRPRRC